MSDGDGQTALHKAAQGGKRSFEALSSGLGEDARKRLLPLRDKKGRSAEDFLAER